MDNRQLNADEQNQARGILRGAGYDVGKTDSSLYAALDRFAKNDQDFNFARLDFDEQTRFYSNVRRDENGRALSTFVEREGRRITIDFHPSATEQAEKQHYSRDTALFEKMDHRAYERVINAAFSTKNLNSLEIYGAWRPKFSLGSDDVTHYLGRSLDISKVNDVSVNSVVSGTTQPQIIKDLSVNLRNGGASHVIQPWMTSGVTFNDDVYRKSVGNNFIENIDRHKTEKQHSNHLHVSYR